MADLGISNTHGNQYGGSVARVRTVAAQRYSTKKKIEFVLHAAVFVASFAFVAAFVCGMVG